MLAPFATASIQQVLALNGKIVADSCSGGPNSTCYSGNGGLPEQMAALDSVNALLVGRPADSSSGTGGSSSVTSGGMSSPTGKSAASSIVVSILDLVMALAVSFFYTFF
jgi:hypothetical protein